MNESEEVSARAENKKPPKALSTTSQLDEVIQQR